MSLQSDAAQLFVTGLITTQGQLDLDIAARIANLGTNRQLYERLTGNPITALASPAGAAFTGAADLLSNRVVYLHAGGTARRPTFRVETGRLIRDQLIRQYFSANQSGYLTNLSSSR